MGKAKQKNQPGGKIKTGNNKGKAPTMKVFKVSNHKVLKSQQMKAKSVSTNLKRLNHQNKMKVKSINDTFIEIQQNIATEPKKEEQKKNSGLTSKVPIDKPSQQPVDMDDAAESFAKL